MNSLLKIGIIGTGQRATAFAKLLKARKDAGLTAVCDSDRTRLESFVRDYGLTDVATASDISGILEDGVADAIIITVPDRLHRDIALRCFDAGRHVLLEKPMALSAEDCRDIVRAREKSGCLLAIGFVLRCTDFFRTIKDIVDSGTLGQVMSISMAEYLNMSHSSSYMRRWHRKSENSGGLLLTKCSHDLDILCWLAGSLPARVSSFGSNNYFSSDKQKATHCSECEEKTSCRHAFDGNFVYMTDRERSNPSDHGFDLCVFNNDKDVVDNQVSILELENGIRAQFSVQLFHSRGTRTIVVSGTDAYLFADMHSQTVRIEYSDGRTEERSIDQSNSSGHGGGDMLILENFVEMIRSGSPVTADEMSGMAATVIGVALEKARLSGSVVELTPPDYAV